MSMAYELKTNWKTILYLATIILGLIALVTGEIFAKAIVLGLGLVLFGVGTIVGVVVEARLKKADTEKWEEESWESFSLSNKE